MLNYIICFQTDTITFLDRVYIWSANQAQHSSWKNLDRKPEQGMQYIRRAKLGLDEIEIQWKFTMERNFKMGL